MIIDENNGTERRPFRKTLRNPDTNLQPVLQQAIPQAERKNCFDFLRNRQFYLFCAIAAVLAYAFSLTELDLAADEGNYLEMLADYDSFFSYIVSTYNELNGRLAANTIEYLFLRFDLLWLWRILSYLAVLCAAYQCTCFFGKFSLSRYNAALLFLLCLSYRVLSSAYFWFTGAIFYLWPATITLCLLRNVSDSFYGRREVTFGLKGTVDLILGGMVMLWSEQAALVLIGFYLLNLADNLMLKKKKLNTFQLITLIIWTVLFFVMLLAPSQGIRLNESTYDYQALQGGVRYCLENGLYWTFSTVFGVQRLPILLLGALILSSADKNKCGWALWVFRAIFSIAVMAYIMRDGGVEGNYLFYTHVRFDMYDLRQGLGENSAKLLSPAPYVFWGAYSILLFILLIANTKNPLSTVIIIAASCATLFIMWLSPTMYVSGNRTSCLFAFGMAAILCKILSENQSRLGGVLLAGSIVNFLPFLYDQMQRFLIYY